MAMSAVVKILMKMMRRHGVDKGTGLAKSLGFDDYLIKSAKEGLRKAPRPYGKPPKPLSQSEEALLNRELAYDKFAKRRKARIERDKAIFLKSGQRDIAMGGLTYGLEPARAKRLLKRKPDVRKRLEKKAKEFKADPYSLILREKGKKPRQISRKEWEDIYGKKHRGFGYGEIGGRKNRPLSGDDLDKAIDRTRKLSKPKAPRPAVRKTLEQKAELATTKALPTLEALRGRGAAKAAKDPLAHLAARNNAMEREVKERMRGYTPGSVRQTPAIQAEKSKIIKLLERIGFIR